MQRLYELPAVLTSFAFREEYFAEIEGMLETAREHHPEWPVVVGRGPVAVSTESIAVSSPLGETCWRLPVPLRLDGSDDDWRKITRMKAWWLREVWRHYGSLAGEPRRVVWLDADARLNAALDIALDPSADLVAGPWWRDPKGTNYETLASGLLVFQGPSLGRAAELLSRWSEECLAQIANLRPPIVRWLDGDQEVLTETIDRMAAEGCPVEVLRLDFERYCGEIWNGDEMRPGALVDQWMMSRKMKRAESRGVAWPPPEEVRRQMRKAASHQSSGDRGADQQERDPHDALENRHSDLGK